MGRVTDCRFPTGGILSYPNGEALLEEALKLGRTSSGRSRILSSPVNMVWNRCISPSVWRSNMTAHWIFTAMKLTMSSRALLKPLPRWHESGDRAAGNGQPYHRYALL